MTSEPAFFVGLLLVVTGAACGIVGTALGRPYTLVAVGGIPFLVAGALLVSAARDRHRFRVTEVVMTPIGDYTGRCPGEHRVGIRVSTAGGAGRVAFRIWANEDFDAPVNTVRVAPNLSFEFVGPVTVTKTGYATAYASVESPNQRSASGAFQVTCTPSG